MGSFGIADFHIGDRVQLSPDVLWKWGERYGKVVNTPGPGSSRKWMLIVLDDCGYEVKVFPREISGIEQV